MSVNLYPYSWNAMPQLQGSHSIEESDEGCLRELRTVLERHGKTSKFGVALLHKHFELRDDEVMVETNDRVARTLTIRPVSQAEANMHELVPTLWRFDAQDGYKCQWCNKNHC